MNETNSKTRSRTNWDFLEQQSDEEIDTSDIPPLGDEFFADAEWQMPQQSSGETVVLTVEPEVLAWFKAQNGDFRRLMSAALQSHIAAQKQVK